MATMVNSSYLESICIPINEILIIQMKEIKKKYKMTWSAFFLHLTRMNKRPEELIRKYNRVYENEKKKAVNFEARISPQAFIAFGSWSAPFSNQGDTLDYLIHSEMTRNKDHFLEEQKNFI